MRYLLDTHGLIWFLSGDAQLSHHARELIEDEKNDLFVSIASLWEIAIKFSIGKLNLEQSFEDMFPAQLENNNLGILAITVNDLKSVSDLPFHHRDPFDRLIIAQSQVGQLPVISGDTVFDRYDVAREW